MKEQSKANTGTKKLTTLLFIIYLIAISWILLFKLGVQFSYMGKRNVNLIPFSEPSILNSENILNALIFVPLGIYAAIKEKGEKWNEMVEETRSITVSDPLVTANSFACTMKLDVTMKERGPMEIAEICVYGVKDGKIISEQFFM